MPCLEENQRVLHDLDATAQIAIRALESKLSTSQSEVNRALWDKNNLKAELEEELSAYKIQISSLQKKLESHTLEKSQTLEARNSEIDLLKKRVNLLKEDNNKLKADIERYRNDLAKSARQEELFERSVLQTKLDYQRKCEEVEKKVYTKTEDFTSDLLKARDHAVAEKERMQSELDSLKRIRSGMGTRADPFSMEASQFDLAEQNKQLKEVIKQMTYDMKELHKLKQNLVGPIDSKYVESVEKEVIELKKEKRKMMDQIETLQGGLKAEEDEKMEKPLQIEISENHPKIQQHINALNNKIGNLEGEKLDLRAQLQKLQAKFDHQVMLSQQHEQEANSSSSKLQHLELESTANKHRWEQEIKRLKKEISNLTLQLSESRREADEYYRGGIQNNLRAIELSDKVSRLTVGMAAGTPWLTSHAQAKLVQDLQDKISQLQQQVSHQKRSNVSHNFSGPNSIKLLQMKLHTAADRIRVLTHEKNMLLESSNRMKAELSSLKEKSAADFRDKPVDEQDGKLDKMEKLQYELTKKQLAFAQRQISSSVDSSNSFDNNDREVPEPPTRDDDTGVQPTSSSRRVVDPVMMSSIDDASIKDVWKVLEHEPSSPSIAGEQATVFSDQSKKKGKLASSSSVKRKKPKIRNYNIKDDF